MSVDRELNVVAVIHTAKGMGEAGAGSRPATHPPWWQADVWSPGVGSGGGHVPGDVGLCEGARMSQRGSGMPVQLLALA